MNPAFLVGAERSGTTLLRLQLSHHPELAWCQEFEYAVDQVGPDGSFPPVAEYVEWLSTHRVFLARDLTVDANLDFEPLVSGFLEQQRERQGKTRVGATVHRRFDRLLHLWPDARFIHLVRDPRDVARSAVGMGWVGNVYTGVSLWLEAERLWERLRGRIAADRWVELRFEDLIRDPEAQLGRLCGFLGVPYRPEMLDYPSTTTYSSPDPTLTEQWKRKLSVRDVRRVEQRAGPLLEDRGYERSGHPPLKVSAPEKAILRFQDRTRRFLFRVRRYGLRLWASDALSRRFGGQEWQRRTRLRLNEIDTRHLK